ncbi:DnaJ domain-containing protein [Cupriavidus sp. WKF15]|uniref:J domain-containing protein n=1 Tax=Cupriavidus sp. WKF15 TaxID=3032282 RepID=UPI0023E32BC2|nr:DnaJ domain-containing protein [Cupriavidus sp. WKF15]WER48410.1 DnaJ domain-containing protein [Cupriavidus sp. WKF15]
MWPHDSPSYGMPINWLMANCPFNAGKARFPCYCAGGKIDPDLYAPASRMHTHYDNLKISRDAPPEVIRAAYKALSQKHHPDRNQDSSESHRVMTIINTAYEVLMDPAKRAQHDAWIAAQEKAKAVASASAGQRARPASTASGASTSPASRAGSAARQARPGASTASRASAPSQGTAKPAANHTVSKTLFVLVVAGAAIYLIIPTARMPAETSRPPEVVTVPETPGESRAAPATPWKPTQAQPRYVRPPVAPNGQSWPAWSSYVPGYPIRKTGGLSSLTVDNSRNPADVFLKVFSLEGGDPVPVRFALVKAGASFEFANMASGNFDVRFMDLDTGEISRTEPFELEEIAEGNGTRYSRMSLTLHGARSGHARTQEIGASEF